MATAKFDTSGAIKRLSKSVKDVIENDEFFEKASKIAVDRIAFEARRGKPLNNSRKFPNLRESTVTRRAARQKFNKTARSYGGAEFSNLTFTGQLIDALTAFKEKNGFSVGVADTKRDSIKLTKNKREKSPGTNQEVDLALRDIGFFLFTAKGVKRDGSIAKRIKQLSLRFLRRALRQNNLRS